MVVGNKEEGGRSRDAFMGMLLTEASSSLYQPLLAQGPKPSPVRPSPQAQWEASWSVPWVLLGQRILGRCLAPRL